MNSYSGGFWAEGDKDLTNTLMGSLCHVENWLKIYQSWGCCNNPGKKWWWLGPGTAVRIIRSGPILGSFLCKLHRICSIRQKEDIKMTPRILPWIFVTTVIINWDKRELWGLGMKIRSSVFFQASYDLTTIHWLLYFRLTCFRIFFFLNTYRQLSIKNQYADLGVNMMDQNLQNQWS